MDIDIKNVHIGEAIEKRRNELGLSKSELGRKIGVPQQHVNRILERETMETKRLIKVSEALGFNFFTLFCPVQHQISAYLAAVTLMVMPTILLVMPNSPLNWPKLRQR